MDFPIPVMPPLPTIHTWSHECLGVYQIGLGNASMPAQASSAYPATSLIIYIPFGLAMPVTVAKLWCYNGATVNGNVNLGIYDVAGTRLVSTGSTAQSGTNVLQVIDVTDTVIGPGDFYLAIITSSSPVTATFFRTAPAQSGFCQAMGMLQEAGSGSTLPTTATFATITSAYIPQIGLTTRADL